MNDATRTTKSKATSQATADRWFPTVERYWRLLHPKTYTSMAWVCVAGGVTITAGAAWTPIAEALVLKHLGITVSLSTPWWAGLLLVLFGLGFATLNNHLSASERAGNNIRSANEHAHDLQVLSTVFAILDESFVELLCDDLHGLNACTTDQSSALDRTVHFLSKPSGAALDQALQTALTDLRNSANFLARFVGLHFFYYPNKQNPPPTRLAMYPEYNIDRGGTGSTEDRAFYDKHQKQLNDLIDKFSASFDNLVHEVKRKFPAELQQLLAASK